MESSNIIEEAEFGFDCFEVECVEFVVGGGGACAL
jgi:hypothetical protein